MPGVEKQRWGQHDARSALPRCSQRANAGPWPPRHSTTLPMDAQLPAGPTFSFFAGRRNRPASFWRWNRDRQANKPPSRPEPKAGWASPLACRPRPPQLSLLSYAPAQRGQGKIRNNLPPPQATQRATCQEREANDMRQGRAAQAQSHYQPEPLLTNCAAYPLSEARSGEAGVRLLACHFSTKSVSPHPVFQVNVFV